MKFRLNTVGYLGRVMRVRESIDSQFFNSLAKIDFSELENVTA